MSSHSSCSSYCLAHIDHAYPTSEIYFQAGIHFILIHNYKTKCYVGRNGNQNQYKHTYKCVYHSRHNRIKGAKAIINVHTNQMLVHTLILVMAP